MKRLSLAIAAALLMAASGVRAQEKPLLFDAPAGANDLDRIKAAKALAARCVACGIPEVTGDTFSSAPNAPKRIRLMSPKGFTAEMIPAVDFLASFPCRTVELRFEVPLGKRDQETYKPGGKSPKGASWTKIRNWDSVAAPFHHLKAADQEVDFLLLDKPAVDVSGKFKILRHPGGDLYGHDREEGIFLTFRGAVVKTLHQGIVRQPDPPHKELLPVELLIDGLRLPTEQGSMGWRSLQSDADNPDLAIWTFPELAAKKPLACLLENPLPFAMKRSE